VQYMMLIYETPADFEARTLDRSSPHIAAWRAYYQSLVSAGVYVGGAPLQTVDTATTVRLKDGKRHVQDGPFADTKEQLGGFILVELPSLDAALAWAARCPAAAGGAVEVRPLAPDMHTTITE
jgi:hypothetical protein